MNLTEKDIQLLEAFWHNQLSDTERLALEARLATDATFRQEARQIQLYTEGLDVIKQRNTRQRLHAIDATLPPYEPYPYQTPPSALPWIKIGLVALALALAALGIWYFAIRAEEPKISAPIAAYFEPYPALGITMSDDDATVRLDALKLYAKKDYKNAIPQLDKAFAVEKDSLLLFYKGIAYIGNGEAAKAILVLESLRTSNTLPIDTVEWFLALAYLETNQKEKAFISLEKVINTEGGRYKVKAQELIEKVSKK